MYNWFYLQPQVFQVDELKSTIIQTIITGYNEAKEEKTDEKVFQRFIQYFYFRPIYYSNTFEQVFNVETCFASTASRR